MNWNEKRNDWKKWLQQAILMLFEFNEILII